MADLNAMTISELRQYIASNEQHIRHLQATMKQFADNPTDPDLALAAMGAKEAAGATRYAVDGAIQILRHKEKQAAFHAEQAKSLEAWIVTLEKNLETYGPHETRLAAFCREFSEVIRLLPPDRRADNCLSGAQAIFQATLDDVARWRASIEGARRNLAGLEGLLK